MGVQFRSAPDRVEHTTSHPTQACSNHSAILHLTYLTPLETSNKKLFCQNTVRLVTYVFTVYYTATIDFLQKGKKKMLPLNHLDYKQQEDHNPKIQDDEGAGPMRA